MLFRSARRAREARRPPSVGQDSEGTGHTPHGPHPRPRERTPQGGEQQQQRNESQERDLRELEQLRRELDEVFGRATRAQRADYLTLMRDLNRDVARRINGGEPLLPLPTPDTLTLWPTRRYLPPGLHIWPYWLYSTSHWHNRPILHHIGTLALTQPKLSLTLQDLMRDPLLLPPALPLRASRQHLIDSCHRPRGPTAVPDPPHFL